MAAEKLEDMVPLPVDAGGEVIHIGDNVICSACSRHGTVSSMKINTDEEGIRYYVYLNDSSFPYRPDELHHYHKPTVEDMLREFGDRYIQVVETPEPIVGFGNEIIGEEDPKEVITEYAAKLQLKEEE